MSRLVQLIVLVTLSVTVNADDSEQEPELPLCPVNVQYFPQNLPMHCRLPRGMQLPPGGIAPGFSMPGNMPPGFSMPQGRVEAAPFPEAAPAGNARPQRDTSNGGTTPPSGFASPPPDKMMPYPFPIPPGFPAPILPPPPMGMPMPIIPGPPPPQKLPVIVMPFYSPDPAFKKHKHDSPSTRKPGKKHRPHSSADASGADCDSTSSSGSDSSGSHSGSSDDGLWRRRRNMNHRRSHRKGSPKHFRARRHRHRRITSRRSNNPELLTPLIQYVTKDGYVIYEKEITKNEAKDWLNVAKADNTKISFQELDAISKKLPGDGQGDVDMLSRAELEKNKTELEDEVKRVEQELFDERNAVKTEKPKQKQWQKKTPKTRKEKFAEKIGTNVQALS